jgi:hypothetical protein
VELSLRNWGGGELEKRRQFRSAIINSYTVRKAAGPQVPLYKLIIIILWTYLTEPVNMTILTIHRYVCMRTFVPRVDPRTIDPPFCLAFRLKCMFFIPVMRGKAGVKCPRVKCPGVKRLHTVLMYRYVMCYFLLYTLYILYIMMMYICTYIQCMHCIHSMTVCTYTIHCYSYVITIPSCKIYCWCCMYTYSMYISTS